MPNITTLVNTAETCHKEVALEYFNAFTGRKDNLEVVALMRKYPELYSRETLAAVSTAAGESAIDERYRRFLLEVFTGNYFSDQLKDEQEQLVNAEGSAVVRFDGEELPYRGVTIRLANEPDSDRRARLEAAYFEVMDQMNPLRAEISSRSIAIAGELGYDSMIDLCEKVSGMQIYPLRKMLGEFLSATDDTYAARLQDHARENFDRDAGGLLHSDISYMLRATRFDPLFPANDMVPALSRTLKGLGIDMENQPNTMLDLEVRPKKSPRAFCIGIDVPRDVRLVLMPRGGQDDFTTLFHEAGHLQFGAHMSPGLDYLYRQHGDTSVHESYAFLLQHLVDDPVWWKEIMGADPGEYPAFARFHRLYMLRRYAGKLHYEIEYHERGGGPELADAYTKWLERSCRIPYPRERYLSDFDNGFYVLQYLQAWIWEVQLRGFLRSQFGETWFTKHAAGDFLRDLWIDGQKYDVWEIAEKLGFDGLDTAPLIEELTA